MSVFLQRIGLDWGTSTLRLYTLDGDEYLVMDQAETFARFLQQLSSRQMRRLRLRSFSQVYADGVILDSAICSQYLAYVLRRSNLRVLPFTRVEIIVSLPTLCFPTTKQLFARALEDIGISKVVFTSSAVASAIGAGFAYPFPQFSLIMHLGESNSEVAGLSFQECHFSHTLHFSGIIFRKSIASFFFARFGLRLGLQQLDTLWQGLGALVTRETTIEAKSLGLIEDQVAALEEQIFKSTESLVFEIEAILDSLSVEEVASISQNGIVVTGGLARQSELLRFLSNRLRLPLYGALDSDECVIRGIATLVGRMNEYV